MKKFLFFVFVSFFSYAMAASPVPANCSPEDTAVSCSIQDYKEKACKPWYGIIEPGFKSAAKKESAPPVEELSGYFITQWKQNLERSGKVPILSDPEKAHVYYLMRGIYAGKWKSPDDVYRSCMSEGSAFPKFLREDLARAKKHFLLRATTQLH